MYYFNIYIYIGYLETKKSNNIGDDIIHDFPVLLCNCDIQILVSGILSIMLRFIAMFFFSCRHVFESKWRNSRRFTLSLLE